MSSFGTQNLTLASELGNDSTRFSSLD